MLAQDPFAALLVSLHGRNVHTLYVNADFLEPAQRDAVTAYLERQAALQERLLALLGATREQAERAAALVLCVDALSLRLCHGWPEGDLPAVDGTTIRFTPVSETEATLDPWPLGVPQLQVGLSARRMTERFDDEAALHAGLDGAPWSALRWVLRATSTTAPASCSSRSMTPRLVTIPISHYCEKARWALDRAGVAYREEPHIQLVHVVAARRAGGGRTVPVFVTDDGTAIGESAAILRWADTQVAAERRLYPDGETGAEAARIEAWLDAGLGPDGRLWMYHGTLPVVRDMAPWALAGTPRWERRAFRRVRPAARPGDPPLPGRRRRRGRRRARARGRRLRRGRRRCSPTGARSSPGERFTAADLTFGALSASVLMPEGYGSPLPPLDVGAGVARDRCAPPARASRRPVRRAAVRAGAPLTAILRGMRLRHAAVLPCSSSPCAAAGCGGDERTRRRRRSRRRRRRRSAPRAPTSRRRSRR